MSCSVSTSLQLLMLLMKVLKASLVLAYSLLEVLDASRVHFKYIHDDADDPLILYVSFDVWITASYTGQVLWLAS